MFAKDIVKAITEKLNDKEKLHQYVQERFKAADKDNSGTLNRQELKIEIQAIYKNADLTPPNDTFIDDMMLMLDDNGSGTLDIEEFKDIAIFALQKLKVAYEKLAANEY